MKELLKSANIPVPLLSPARHGLCYSTPEHPEQERICAAYKEQVIMLFFCVKQFLCLRSIPEDS